MLRNGPLPVAPSMFAAPNSLLVTGPNALLIASGNYNSQTNLNITAWDGIHSYLGPNSTYSPGCVNVTSNDTSGFAAAVAAAKLSKLVVAVMGLDTTVEFEDSTRTVLSLPGVQEQLILALAASGTAIILVLISGSAISLSLAVQSAVTAILWIGYGGEEAGTALADVIFGECNY